MKNLDELIENLFVSKSKKQDDFNIFIKYYKENKTAISFLLALLDYHTKIRPKQREFVLKILNEIFSISPNEKEGILCLIKRKKFYNLFSLSSFDPMQTNEADANIISLYSENSIEILLKNDLIDEFNHF